MWCIFLMFGHKCACEVSTHRCVWERLWLHRWCSNRPPAGFYTTHLKSTQSQVHNRTHWSLSKNESLNHPARMHCFTVKNWNYGFDCLFSGSVTSLFQWIQARETHLILSRLWKQTRKSQWLFTPHTNSNKYYLHRAQLMLDTVYI